MKKTKIAAYTCSLALASAFAVAWASGKTLRADNETPDDPENPIEGVEINEENFPDEEFRKFVKKTYDINEDDVLDSEEIQNIFYLDLKNPRVKSLKGIEYFSNLFDFTCTNPSSMLCEVDFSKNTHLASISIESTKIEKLDLSHNTQLYSVNCSGNIIDTLILGENAELVWLNCESNKLAELDLSKCPNLQNLYCAFNKLESLNLNGCINVENIDCSNNRFRSLDVSPCRKMKIFYGTNNSGLTSLDLSKNKELQEADCSYNKLTDLKIQGLSKLVDLNIAGNLYLKIDGTGCVALEHLNCGESYVTEIDLSTLPNLKSLDTSYNYLNSIDLSKNTKLESLYITTCAGKITSLDIRNCEMLVKKLTDPDSYIEEDDSSYYYFDSEGDLFFSTDKHISVITKALDIDSKNFPDKVFREYVSENFDPDKNAALTDDEIKKITEIDLTGKDISSLTGIELFTELKNLNCSGDPKKGGKLTELDVRKNVALTTLNCSNQPIKDLDLSYNSKLSILDCSNTKITELNLQKNASLAKLFIHHNAIATIDISKCQPLVDNITADGVKLAKQDDYYFFADEEGTVYLTFDEATKIEGVKDLPTPSPAPEKGTTIGDFVDRLYTVALGRASEESGKKYWVDEITSGRKTGGDCGLFFLTGEEFANRKLSVEDFVETLYQTFFGRESEASGKAYWVGVLKNGGDRNAVVKGFIDSKEWCNICADYGVRSGAPTAKAERASKNATDFATRLYTCCLGREAEEAGLKYWSLALTNLEQTGCSAAKEFFGSAEFANLKLKDDEYVKRLYTTFMGRDPQAGEVSYWAGEIAKGTQTRSSVLAFFGSSEEFSNICAKYGIERGTM